MATTDGGLRVEGATPPPVPVPGRPARRTTPVVRHLGADDRSAPRVRIVDAMLECLARQGTQKTTVDDVARCAGLSRATVYRLFPGGKEAMLAAVVETEVARFYAGLAVAMGEAEDLGDALVAGIVHSARRIAAHRALRYMSEHEPGVVLPHLAFGEMDKLLLGASAFAAPFFARWLEPEQASRAAEWAVRIVLSYVATPTERVDLTEVDDARHLVRTFVLPGIQALRSEDEARRRSSGERRGPGRAPRRQRRRAKQGREGTP
jgi:AcrR family transcriptional regulator